MKEEEARSKKREDPVAESLGDRIARLRRAKGWSQRELGDRIGVTGAQVSKFERNSYVPRADILGKLSAALDVSSDFLLTGRRRDPRLRERLEELESLPDELRCNLLEFLDSLLAAYRLFSRRPGLPRRS